MMAVMIAESPHLRALARREPNLFGQLIFHAFLQAAVDSSLRM